MKRNIKILMLIFAVVLTTGCNQWLEVKPRTEQSKDELFSTQRGFQDALIGVYIQCKDTTAYGGDLTFKMIEYMSSIYDVKNKTVESNLKEHNWDDAEVETKINASFARLYKIISSSTAILEEIDQKKLSFDSENEYKWLKGEALAIRAMCHFDLLRLFGPIPSKVNLNQRILPYVTTFGHDITSHNTWDEYCKLLLEDITTAEELLKNDPICDGKTENQFFSQRQYRFNYYAVKALQSRIYIWIGKPELALKAAQEVIEAKNADGSDKFKLGTATALDNDDRLFTSEHIMALHNFKLIDSYSDYFANGTLYRGSTYSTIKKDIYGGSGSDIREPEIGRWWSIFIDGSGKSRCFCDKYRTTKESSINVGYRIPLFRLSEMYLIMAEFAPIGQAQGYYDTFLKSRNLNSVVLTDLGRATTIRKEYLKEFYGEGHIFYVYKRYDTEAKDILWKTMAAGWSPNYVLPKPSDEIVYPDVEPKN